MKRRIYSAENNDNIFDDALSDLKEDFDYVVSGLEKLSRSGANASQDALAIIENISNDLSASISDIADRISE
jgi:hypothetical protein